MHNIDNIGKTVAFWVSIFVTYFFIAFFAGFTIAFLAGCDMEHVSESPTNRSGDDDPFTEGEGEFIGEEEREELERAGHFLKLTGMPGNTQIPNISSASVANSVAAIARMDRDIPVKIFREETSNTVYIPLIYNNGNEFTESGDFYVMFAIHVDALTKLIVTRSDSIIVRFSDGRGELDVCSLPQWGPPFEEGEGEFIGEEEREELERAGHFLKLTGMPGNTQVPNIASASVANSVASIARIDQNTPVKIFREEDSNTVYIPLAYSNGNEFTESGDFYVMFAIHVDALTRIVVVRSDNITVGFSDGRGELDVYSLPLRLLPNAWTGYTAEPHALTITGLPPMAGVTSLSDVFVWNQAGKVAKCANYTMITVSLLPNGKKAAVVPLVYDNKPNFNGQDFLDSGSFLVTFSFFPDATQSVIVTLDNNCVADFTDGSAVLDLDAVAAIPYNYLTITNLPPQLSASGVSNVFVWDQAGKVAQCADYSALILSGTPTASTVRIPLLHANSKSIFSDTGDYHVSFDANADALNRIAVSEKDAIAVRFVAGNGTLDAGSLPVAEPPVRTYLTITNLPPQLSASGVSNVFVWNQVGRVAQCADYNALILSGTSTASTVRIPLCYPDSRAVFADTGSYFVSFDANADALNRITISNGDAVVVNFSTGNGTLDAATLPVKEQPVYSYLTIANLPPQLSASGVSSVFVWDQAGKVAQCADYNALILTGTPAASAVRIPLCYPDSNAIFADNGSYFVSFDVNVDALNRITVARENAIIVSFSMGSGTLDANALPVAPRLTISGLPLNAVNAHFSEVSIYNTAEKVAQMSNANDIIITRAGSSVTAEVPLVYARNPGKFFQDTGAYFLTLSIAVDAETHILISGENPLRLQFDGGYASYDMSLALGYFAGGLRNPADAAAPVVRQDTTFEINGVYHHVQVDTQVSAAVPLNLPSMIYVYAVQYVSGVEFEYSTVAPSYNAAKKGYYSGNKRALWKMFFYQGQSDQYLAKTLIDDPNAHLSYHTLDPAERIPTPSPYYSLGGSNNPRLTALALPEGVYLFALKGAGGGAGHNVHRTTTAVGSDDSRPGGIGGDGGAVAELVFVSRPALFTLFTGDGGADGNPSLLAFTGNSTTSPGVGTVSHIAPNAPGGGGGGSGSYIYSDDGYFLCAGGGGGGSAASASHAGGIGDFGNAPVQMETFNRVQGGAGGAGGSIGPGGDGEQGLPNSYFEGALGGKGGGANPPSMPAGIYMTGYGFGGQSSGNYAGGGTSAYVSLPPPFDWQNTNDANGQGADGVGLDNDGVDGEPGGNNRDSVRGGGAFGGSPGSIVIYKLF